MQYSILEASIEIERGYFSFWQSPIWKNILTKSGQASEAFYFGNINGNIILVEIRSVGGGQYAAFSLGVSSSQIQEKSEGFFCELFRILREKGCIFYQIEPIISDNQVKGMNISLGTKISPFLYRGFLTPHTRLLDLHSTEDEILKQMHEKGRYNIRLAEKRGVTIESAQITPENIDLWMLLLSDTTERDGFSHNSRRYYEAFLTEIELAGSGNLLFARYEGRVIAAMIVVYTATRAIYYYGASVSERELRKHMAPYLLQWYAIQESKRRGIPIYDFLGVANPDNKDDPLRSVTEFKEKFGGYRYTLPEKLCIPLTWKGRIFLFIRFLFRK